MTRRHRWHTVVALALVADATALVLAVDALPPLVAQRSAPPPAPSPRTRLAHRTPVRIGVLRHQGPYTVEIIIPAPTRPPSPPLRPIVRA